jgi:His/Glu/Gln/Arg/opine family amino acid ABC transporter permease subunit
LDLTVLTAKLISMTPYDIYFLLKGALVTLALSAGAIGVGSCIGGMMGWIRTLKPVKKNPLLWWLTSIYVDTIRGTPLLLQVYFIYYAIPPLTGINTSIFFAGVTSLALFQGAYVSEVVMAGIDAIGKTQWWAGYSLGMGYFQVQRYVILPQAVRIMIPPYIGVCLGVIKDTSLVSTIGFIELAFSAGIVGRRTLEPMPPWIMAAVIYFIICFPISRLSQRLERRLKEKG